MGPSLSSPSTFLLVLAFVFLCFTSRSEAAMDGNFKCRSPATCSALVGYLSPNATTLGALQKLFTVSDLRSILGANNLPISTSADMPVRANQTVRIPIPCRCSNGTGVSDGVPLYTIKKDDGLYHIAADVFGNLVKFEKIGDANGIKDKNLIIEGDKLRIPLPCSCDQVDGQDVVHYAHVVRSGSSVGEIAAQFGADNRTLLRLNKIAGDAELLADLAFDVPLRACNSSVKRDSLDYPMRVANGSYVVTANNCVRCACDAANNWTLQCEPSRLGPSGWRTCRSLQCSGSERLMVGNSTETDSCGRARCAYAGYSNQTIETTLVTENTCAAPTSRDNHASRIALNWNSWFIFLLLSLLGLHLLR